MRVANTDLVRSHMETERANTDLVGVNTGLEEKIHGMFLPSCLFPRVCFVLSDFPLLAFVGLKDELLAAQVEARSTKAQLEGRSL